MKISIKRIGRTVSIVMGLLLAFFAEKWFETAYLQPSYVGKIILLAASLIILTIIVYLNLDDEGKL